jgi:hypothetical protein
MKRTRLHRPLAWTLGAILGLALVGGAWLRWGGGGARPSPAASDLTEPTSSPEVPNSSPPDSSRTTPGARVASPDTPAKDAVIGHDRFATADVHEERWLGAPDAEVRQRWRLTTLAGEPSGVARVGDHLTRHADGTHRRIN